MKNKYALHVAVALFLLNVKSNAQCINQTVGPNSSSIICNGSGTISLASSEAGVNYYVRNDANNQVVTGPFAGTGSGLILGTGSMTASSIFNVLAKKNTGALAFDGVDDYVSIPNTFNSNSNFTWEAWIKTGSDGTIFSKTNATGSWASGGKSLYIKNGKITFEVFGVSSAETYNVYNDNNWHHVGVTAEMGYMGGTDDRVRIYVDGIFVVEKNNWDINVNSETGLINKIGYTNSNFPVTSAYNGIMEDVKIWTTIRTATDVVNDMSSCLTGTETGLSAYYTFEDASGTSLTDISGGDNTGTLVNMASTAWVYGRDECGTCSLMLTQKPVFVITQIVDQSLSAASLTLCSNISTTITSAGSEAGVNYYLRDNSTYSVLSGPYAGTGNPINFNTGIVANTTTYNVIAGKMSGALSFDGIDDYVMVNESAVLENLGQGAFTMESWIYPTNITGTRSVIRKDGDYNLYLNNGNVVAEVFTAGGNGGAFYQATSANTITPNKWSHVAAVWDGTAFAIYINTISNTLSISNSSSAQVSKFCIGGSKNFGQVFEGKIDELRMWSSARSVSQLTANIGSCLSSTETALVAYYQFENGRGSSVLTDKSPTNNNGLLSNMDLITSWRLGTENCGCSLMMSSLPAVTVNSSPTVTANSGTICSGSSFTIAPSGATSYTITGGTFTVNPAITTSYSVTGSNTTGCVSAPAIANILVNASPTISVNNYSICSGSSVIISPSGSDTYTITGGTFTVNPTISTSYSVTGTSTAGCAATNTAIATVSVNTTPTITVNSGSVCSGNSFVIVPSGGSSYTISGGTFTVSPAATSAYTITGSNGACISPTTTIANVTVNATPTISVNNATVCPGTSVALVATGAGSYTITGNSFTVSPLTTTSYSITGTGTNACVSNMVTSTVTVNDSPTVTVNSGSVCAGSSFTIIPSGANSYTVTGNTFTVNPSVTTSYSVSGTNTAGCVSAITIATVTVNSTPTITLAGGAVCPGNSFTLMPAGASNYTYSGGSNIVTPNITTSYTVTGSSAQGCVAANTVIATVNVVNTLTITVNGNTSICSGQSTTLTANGASTYTWNGSAQSSTILLTPAITTNYTVTGASGTCSNTTVVTLSVSPVPTITVNSGSVCAGSTFTLMASGASSYTYSNGSSTVSPNATTSYSVTGSNSGCVSTNTAISLVTVNALPTVIAASSNSVICVGSSAILAGSGASSYVWSDAQTGGSITIAPPVSTVYTVTGTDANGCVNTATVLQRTDACTGINTVAASILIFGIYPNPNNGQFVIETGENVNVLILNSIGQIVYNQTTSSTNTSININNLVNGIYFVKAVANGNQHVVRIVKE